MGRKINKLPPSWNGQGSDIEVVSNGNGGKVDTQSPQAGDTVPCSDSVEVSK